MNDQLTADQLVLLFDLNGAGSTGFVPAEELAHIIAAHAEIWEEVDKGVFTEHGAGHSRRIIEYFMLFKPLYDWSPYERLVFVAAAYLHDIGMQFNKWGELAASDGQSVAEKLGLPLPKPYLNDKTIRDGHVDTGFRLASAEAHRRRAWRKPKTFCSGSSEGMNLLSRAIRVAFAHSKGEMWTACHVPEEELKARTLPTHSGQSLRLRLLSGIFKLCDELDGSYTRVPKIDELWRPSLPEDSRLHWLACAFTYGVEMSGTSQANVRFAIKWRIPQDADERLRSLIVKLLERMRTNAIQATVDSINRMFLKGREGTFYLETEAKRDPAPTESWPFEITDALRDLLERQDEILDPVGAVAVRSANSERAPVGDVLASSTVGAAAADNSLAAKMWRWVNKHGIGGHFELVRGPHTNTLIRLRALVSDAELVQRIASHVRMIVEREGIDEIVAIGTGCVPISVRVALETGCGTTFTTHRIFNDGTDESLDEHLTRTHLLSREGERRILLLDDLVARGRTGTALVQTLRTNYGVPLERLHYVALFRISSVDLDPGLELDVEALCNLPEIYYADGEDTCAKCLAGENNFVRETSLTHADFPPLAF